GLLRVLPILRLPLDLPAGEAPAQGAEDLVHGRVHAVLADLVQGGVELVGALGVEGEAGEGARQDLRGRAGDGRARVHRRRTLAGSGAHRVRQVGGERGGGGGAGGRRAGGPRGLAAHGDRRRRGLRGHRRDLGGELL